LSKASKILQQRKLSYENSHAPSVEEIFEVADKSLVSSIQQILQTSERQEKLQTQYGPLRQKYLSVVLSGKKAVNINNVYGVYFNSDGTMLDHKRIDLDKNDVIIVDRKKYPGTSILYELIFKKFLDKTICTNADKQKYKNIPLATNAHKRGHSTHNPIMGNKGHKYRMRHQNPTKFQFKFPYCASAKRHSWRLSKPDASSKQS